MSRSRNVKPGFFKNEVLAELPMDVRLLFIGLWTQADREGRLEYRPRKIKAELFPYDDVNVEDGISGLVEGGFLHAYDDSGTIYIQIINWAKHQNPHHKEVGSTIPAPAGHVDKVCAGYIPLSNTIRRRIYARDGRVCKACGATHGLSIDHIIPISKGGNSVDENLQVLCLGCNVQKGTSLGSVNADESSKTHPQAMDEPCGSVVVPLIPDSPFLIPSTTEANASAADAAPVAAPVDPIWGTGLAFLIRRSIPEKQARALLGKLRQACGDVETGSLLLQAETDDISDPAPWLMAAASKRRSRAGPQSAQQPPSKTLSAIQTLQAMKHGNVDPRRDTGRPEQAHVLELGQDPGGGHDRGNRYGVG